MSTEERVLVRVRQLLQSLSGIPYDYTPGQRPDLNQLRTVQEAWAATLSLAANIYGPDSQQASELRTSVTSLRNVNNNPGVMDGRIALVLGGFLTNLQAEIQGGLLAGIADAAIASILGDFVVLADQAFSAGHANVAAVLASAALEDALKRKAVALGIDASDKDLSAVVNALKAKGLFSGAEKGIIASYVTLRNCAMHGDWSKISGPDVASLLGYLKTFLTQQLAT